jgi:hypothetical protein
MALVLFILFILIILLILFLPYKNSTKEGFFQEYNTPEERLADRQATEEITKMFIKLTVAPGTDKKRRFTLRKNGVDTALSITIAAGSAPTTTPYSDLTNSVSFAVGDRMTIKRQNLATAAGGAVSGISLKLTI